MTARRLVAGLSEAVLCVGGFLLWASVMALLFGLFNAIGGGIVHGLFLNPKGFVGGLIQFGIPCIASVSIATTLVLKRLLGPLFDRLERWKALGVVLLMLAPVPAVQAQGEATLFVASEATWPVFIYVDGESFCYVADTKDRSCRGKISPGKHTFEALVGSEVIATQKVTLEPNTVFTWTVREK